MNSRKICLIAAAWACITAPAAIAQEADIDALREEIRTTWAKRREGIESLRVGVTVNRFVPGTEDQNIEGPFDQVSSRHYLNTQREITFLSAGKKRWLKLHTDENLVQAEPLILKPYTVTFGFDGKETRMLLYGGLTPMPSCQVERSETPDRLLTDGQPLVPLLMWSELDEYFDRQDWEVDRMAMESQNEDGESANYVRFSMPRSSDRWTATLDLDPEHGWIPVRWKGSFNGETRFSHKLLYDISDPAEPKISGWKSEHYKGRHKLEWSEVAQVDKLEINQPIADEEFEVPFPAGVQVMTINEKGRRHIVLPRKDRKDKDKPIPADQWQFGKPKE